MIAANGVLEFMEFCDVMAEWLNTDQNEELRLCFRVGNIRILITKDTVYFVIVCFVINCMLNWQ